MKHAVYCIVIGFILILTTIIILTINGKMTRRGDMENALSLSVENAVETTMKEKTYTISDEQEFISDFTQNLLLQISNDSEIEVQVAKADYEKGLLSVKVIEHFLHPNGNEGKNECNATVVFEQNPTTVEFVTITYLLDDETVYKEYQLTKGDDVIVPKAPAVDGKEYVGWKERDGDSIVTDFGQVKAPTTYVAVFK